MSYHYTSVLPLMDRTAMCTRSRETAQLSVKQNSDWLVVRNYQHNLTFSVIHNQNGGEKIEKREKQVIETVAVHDLKWNPYIKLLFWFSWWFVCVLHLCVCVIHLPDISFVHVSYLISRLVPLFLFALFCSTGWSTVIFLHVIYSKVYSNWQSNSNIGEKYTSCLPF